MKAPNTYRLNNPVFYIRDAGQSDEKPINQEMDQELARRFRDAAAIFRIRVELLTNLDHVTTPDEEESMTFMLETLLKGKRRLVGGKKRGSV
jgi:hypothetical protein